MVENCGSDAEPGVKRAFPFQLHWNGSSVSEEPYPAEHLIEDMRAFEGYLFESVQLRETDELHGESPNATPDLHLITPIGVQPTFVSLTPGVPQYAPHEEPFELGFLHLSSDEEALWGAANPVSPHEYKAAGLPPAELTILRYSGGEWRQVVGFGSHPQGCTPEGASSERCNPFTQLRRTEEENETVNSIAAEPGAHDAWLALTSPHNTNASRTGAAPAMVARVSASGAVSEQQQLPAEGEGVGLKGAASKIACPAANDCWLVTEKGWLFHYSNAAARQLPENGDLAFSSLITFRPPDEGVVQVQPDAPPPDDSGLLGEPPPTISLPTETPSTSNEVRVPVPLLTNLHSRIVHGATLELRFHLAVKARVRLIAKRGSRVVASTPMRTLAAGNRKLLLVLNRREWPKKLELKTHALGPLPTTSTKASNVNNVSTSLAVLDKTGSFGQLGPLP